MVEFSVIFHYQHSIYIINIFPLVGGRDGRVTISPQGIVGYSSDSNEERVRIASKNNNRRQDISSSHSIVETQGNENSQHFHDAHNEPLHQRNEPEGQPLLRHVIPPQYLNGKAKDCPLLSLLVFRCSQFTFRHSKQLVYCTFEVIKWRSSLLGYFRKVR